jgi:hypothetical protein
MVKNKIFVAGYVLAVLFLIGFIFASPYFSPSGTVSNLTEDQSPLFQYNFTNNVTNPENDTLSYSIESINSTLYSNSSYLFYNWITINSTNGVLNINSSLDNQTGRYNISVKVINTIPEGSISVFYFVVNATNDKPYFVNISNVYNLTYNLTSSIRFTESIIAGDEELHYPLKFELNFTNCTLAIWSNRTNCNLLSFIEPDNYSMLMNYTPAREDVGIYYANISVRDSGQKYNCSSNYCSANYSVNRTTYYNNVVIFNVFNTLEINITDCNNKIFQENISNSCRIDISTKSASSNFNLSSYAFLRNSASLNVLNRSWFISNYSNITTNYLRSVYINVTPHKTEVGNWSINISVVDNNENQSKSEIVWIFVNRTYNDNPDISDISNKLASIETNYSVDMFAYDDDSLIPDKNDNFGGYNESISFIVRIYNSSNLSQQLNFSNYSLSIIDSPIINTNITQARLLIRPNSSEFGNYSVNITVYDKQNSLDFTMFSFDVFINSVPYWGNVSTFFNISEDSNFYINLSRNVSDLEGNNINFSYTLDNSFDSFSLTSKGIINFTPNDLDVGEHSLTIQISDGYLTNTSRFNFSISNINDLPNIVFPFFSVDIINGTLDNSSNIIALEDNITTLIFWIDDDDYKIPSIQKSYYNESLNLSVNVSGPNLSIMNVVRDYSFPVTGDSTAKYQASFIPRKSDVGTYNLLFNVSDKSNSSDTVSFNMTVLETEHSPVLENVSIKFSGTNRNLYFCLNASDIEDGNISCSQPNNNFTFSYNFLEGSDFIKNNNSIFNVSKGEFNVTFNSSNYGRYRINITVNDSSGRIDYQDFYIYVYKALELLYPASSYSYNLLENATYNFSFLVNNSVLDNVTYTISINKNSGFYTLYNSSYFGNLSYLNFSFKPDFSNETYNSLANLSLFAYPSNSQLSNFSEYNLTVNFNISISHGNSPLTFYNNIGGVNSIINDNSPILLSLDDYFRDLDAVDNYYNQTIRFNYSLIPGTLSGNLTINITNWEQGNSPTINFSSTANASGNYTITAYEYNESNSSQLISNVTSNNFSIILFVETDQVTVPQQVPSSGGGGGGSSSVKPVSFKLIAPGGVFVYYYEKVVIPLKLYNNGENSFREINLTSNLFKDGTFFKNYNFSFDQNYINILKPKETKNITLTVFFNTNESGNYEILVNATSKDPVYFDWVKISLNIRQNVTYLNELEKYLVFTEELIVKNPECRELLELVNEAKKYYGEKDYSNSLLKAEKAVDSCKKGIEQSSNLLSLGSHKNGSLLKEYLFFVSILSLFLGILYYFISKTRFKKGISDQKYNDLEERL